MFRKDHNDAHTPKKPANPPSDFEPSAYTAIICFPDICASLPAAATLWRSRPPPRYLLAMSYERGRLRIHAAAIEPAPGG
jgi:hypothetical protein